MSRSLVLFVPNLGKIQVAKSKVDLLSLSAEEVLTELFIGELLIAENSRRGNILFLENVDVLGFVLNLRLRVSEMKRVNERSNRITSAYQFYDIDIEIDGEHITLRDRIQESHEVRLNASAFVKQLNGCVSDIYGLLQFFFPEISSRKDSDSFRQWFLQGSKNSRKV